MNRLTIVTCAAFLAGAIALGCDSEDTKTYDVAITWNVGGGFDCNWSVQGGTLIPLEDVTVTVYEEEGDEDPIDGPTTVSCEDFEYEIPRLKRGKYWVEVEAWGEYDGQDLPILKDEMEVRAPRRDDDDNEFTLLLAPGDIHVTWSFANGMMCGPNEVATIDISLTDEDVECDEGQYTIADKPGFTEYSVLVSALDENGDELFSGSYDENPFTLLPGETYDAHVVLE